MENPPVRTCTGQGDDPNDLISEKIGTRHDQYDMLRMGKTPQLNVCESQARGKFDQWLTETYSVTLGSCLWSGSLAY